MRGRRSDPDGSGRSGSEACDRKSHLLVMHHPPWHSHPYSHRRGLHLAVPCLSVALTLARTRSSPAQAPAVPTVDCFILARPDGPRAPRASPMQRTVPARRPAPSAARAGLCRAPCPARRALSRSRAARSARRSSPAPVGGPRAGAPGCHLLSSRAGGVIQIGIKPRGRRLRSRLT